MAKARVIAADSSNSVRFAACVPSLLRMKLYQGEKRWIGTLARARARKRERERESIELRSAARGTNTIF